MDYKVGIIGLGYVGLPLAVESGKLYPTIGLDIDPVRINELRAGVDKTREVSSKDLSNSKNLFFTSNSDDIRDCDFYIVTVPTPVDENKNPDLTSLKKASETIALLLKKGDTVVYESTVYPGCTEEICVPILEKSGLKFNVDFFCGYSPERINPGDKEHRLTTIRKITSGSTAEAAEKINQFYSSFIDAGTHKIPSIKVAEAAKVIENIQRDINIALVNEFALIFEKLGIDTLEVLEAAGTKWNFLPFRPGLVGGHCISIDPFYLAHKAKSIGHNPQIILSGRKINDQIGQFVAQKVIKLLGQKGKLSNATTVLIIGFTFKGDCPDSRNTKIIDIYDELVAYGLKVDIYDPQVDIYEVKSQYKIDLVREINENYDAIIIAVNHKEFLDWDWGEIRSKTSVIYDVKGILPKKLVDGRL